MNTQPRPVIGNLIRKYRKQQKMTLQDLGANANVSVGYLSQVERDLATPSLSTLAQIARALGVSLETFISSNRPSDGLTRAATRRKFTLAEGSVSYETLGVTLPGGEMSSFILHVPPGFVSETANHEGEELIVILLGEVEIGLGGEVISMREGDSLHYMGDQPHWFANRSDSTTSILYTGTNALLRQGTDDPLPETIQAQNQ